MITKFIVRSLFLAFLLDETDKMFIFAKTINLKTMSSSCLVAVNFAKLALDNNFNFGIPLEKIQKFMNP
jgi:hypothetical protein